MALFNPERVASSARQDGPLARIMLPQAEIVVLRKSQEHSKMYLLSFRNKVHSWSVVVRSRRTHHDERLLHAARSRVLLDSITRPSQLGNHTSGPHRCSLFGSIGASSDCAGGDR
eukprot:scaffold99456_cov68-Phaeocystis_antarctica.AAC.1